MKVSNSNEYIDHNTEEHKNCNNASQPEKNVDLQLISD